MDIISRALEEVDWLDLDADLDADLDVNLDATSCAPYGISPAVAPVTFEDTVWIFCANGGGLTQNNSTKI
jgi:hypothetical protein